MSMNGQMVSEKNREGRYLQYRNPIRGQKNNENVNVNCRMNKHADYTESKLRAIEFFDSDKSICFRIAKANGEIWNIRLRGVDRLLLTDVREQNVIERILLWDKDSQDLEFEATVSALVTGGSSETVDPAFLPVIREVCLRIKDGKLKLLTIDAIYGGQMIALAQTIQFDLVTETGETLNLDNT